MNGGFSFGNNFLGGSRGMDNKFGMVNPPQPSKFEIDFTSIIKQDNNNHMSIYESVYNKVHNPTPTQPRSIFAGVNIDLPITTHTSKPSMPDFTGDARRITSEFYPIYANKINMSEEGCMTLALNEGYSKEVYPCQKKQPTIGLGGNLNSSVTKEVLKQDKFKHLSPKLLKEGKQTVTEEEGFEIFVDSINLVEKECRRFPGYKSAPQEVQDIVVDMTYQLGSPSFKSKEGVYNTLAKIGNGEATGEDLLREIKKLDWADHHKHRVARYEKLIKKSP